MGWYRHDVPERDRLVLWDVDHTLINAGGLSAHLYGVVLLQLFGRELGRPAPMAGRTDRAIILDTFTLAGVPEPGKHVCAFARGLATDAHVLSGGLAPTRRQVAPAPGRHAGLAT